MSSILENKNEIWPLLLRHFGHKSLETSAWRTGVHRIRQQSYRPRGL